MAIHKSPSKQTVTSSDKALGEIERLRDLLAEKEAEIASIRLRSQTLSEAINIGYWAWDVKSDKPSHLSPELAAIFGMGADEFYRTYQREEDLYEYIHPDDLEHYISNLSMIDKPEYPANKVHSFDYRIVRPNGEVRYLRELEYAKDEVDGELLHTYGAIQDITDLRKSWLALEESEQRYVSLFSKLPLGVMEQDWSAIKQAIDELRSQGIHDLKSYFEDNPDRLLALVEMISITSVNDALLKIYGAESVEEFIAEEENPADWWDEEWARLYANQFIALAGPNRINYAELRENRMDGSEFETRLISSVVKGDEDSWKRILTIIEDVTERKQNEFDLVKAKESAEKANRAKSEFLATMSHEIRTPMNGVLGMTELLMNSKIDDRSRQLASTAHRSAESLLEIINEILDFSKIEAGKMELFEEDFRLREAIESVVEVVTGLADRKGLETVAHLSEDLPESVRGDPLRFRQILINLLGNAVKFTETGKIQLDVRLKGPSEDDFLLEIEVSDTGPGIPVDLQSDIFNAFTQVESGVSRRHDGTGLGLAITSRLVELMSGDIELESKPGKGALFRLKLPFTRASDNPLSTRSVGFTEPAEIPDGDEAATKRLFQGNILLAEDNPVNQEVAFAMLKILGCDVDIAENGAETLKAACERQYDLILMDCHMPEMDGFEASREIRRFEEQRGSARVPIIALTADIKKGIEEECSQAGMDGYLSKPFKQAQLETLLRQWLAPAEMAIEPPVSVKPSLDVGVLKDLRSLSQASGRDILGKSVGYFLEQAPNDLTLMKQSNLEGDLASLQKIAHSLKSSSANLGAKRLSLICEELESLARENSAPQIPSRLQALEELLPSVLAELKQIVSNPNDNNPVESAPIPSVENSPSATILIVDDDETFRRTTCEALRAFGYRMIEASDGDEALEQFDRSPPDLVLLDAMMSGRSGFEVCRLMRDRFDVDIIPVMMLTGLGDLQSVNQAFESGASDFIVKPVNYAVLSASIRFQLRAAANQSELKTSREQLASAQRVAGIGYWQWEVDTHRFTLSEHLAEMLSLQDAAGDITLEEYLQRIHPQDRKLVRDSMTSASLGDKPNSYDYRLNTFESKTIIVRQELNSRNSRGIVMGTVQDVTEQRESEMRIRQLAYTDTLTGLASRTSFHQHLEEVIRAADRRQERFALLFVDLDGFKDVNDSLGHDTGDMLLKEIAARLKGVTRDTDFVARLSGDEFCILVDNISEQYGAAYVAERCLQDVHLPIDLDGQTLRPSCSIGIAYFPDNGEDSRSLLKAADSAMYAAKESGKNCYVYYQPEFTEKAEKRLRTEQELRLAVDNDEIELLYQPQIDLGTGRVVGVEVLPVWNHPTLGSMPQSEFADIAERIGIIKPLTQWIAQNACRQAMVWKQSGLPGLRIAINIPSVYFWDSDFVDMVTSCLTESGLTPSSLELEITESVTHSTGPNQQVFEQLRKLGVRVAIQSYGSGYSSLSTLRQLPIDCLKIDPLFIRDMLHDNRSSILLGTIVGAAHAMGHIVIAEGVEDENQLKVLTAVRCDLVQGNFFSRAVFEHMIPSYINTDFIGKSRLEDSTKQQQSEVEA